MKYGADVTSDGELLPRPTDTRNARGVTNALQVFGGWGTETQSRFHTGILCGRGITPVEPGHAHRSMALVVYS